MCVHVYVESFFAARVSLRVGMPLEGYMLAIFLDLIKFLFHTIR